MEAILKHKYALVIFVLIILSILLSFLFQERIGFFHRDKLLVFIEYFGAFAPLAVVGIIALEVVIAPLPGGVMPVLSGIVFGPVLGTIYSWGGNVLGSVAAFFLARLYGERVVRFFAPSFQKAQYEHTVEAYQNTFWMLYAFPLTAVDILSFAMGLSSIRFQKFVGSISAAFLIRMTILNIFGDALSGLLFI